MEVKRWGSPGWRFFDTHPNGAYVLAKDFDALRAKLEKARAWMWHEDYCAFRLQLNDK